jgi:hypothetical protein
MEWDNNSSMMRFDYIKTHAELKAAAADLMPGGRLTFFVRLSCPWDQRVIRTDVKYRQPLEFEPSQERLVYVYFFCIYGSIVAST